VRVLLRFSLAGGLVLFILGCPEWIRAAGEDGLSIVAIDEKREPLAGVIVDLVLFEFQETEITALEAGNCTTDQMGRCQIEIEKAPQDAAGLIRGQLKIGGHGQRSIIWEGGILEIFLWLDARGQFDIPGESSPYAGQEPDEGLPVKPKMKLRASNIVWPVIIVGGFFSILVFRRKVDS
jgi:hypothetical protein